MRAIHPINSFGVDQENCIVRKRGDPVSRERGERCGKGVKERERERREHQGTRVHKTLDKSEPARGFTHTVLRAAADRGYSHRELVQRAPSALIPFRFSVLFTLARSNIPDAA